MMNDTSSLDGSKLSFGSSKLGGIQVSCFGKRGPARSVDMVRNTMSRVGSKLDSILVGDFGKL